jgi:hypothetical protein
MTLNIVNIEAGVRRALTAYKAEVGADQAAAAAWAQQNLSDGVELFVATLNQTKPSYRRCCVHSRRRSFRAAESVGNDEVVNGAVDHRADNVTIERRHASTRSSSSRSGAYKQAAAKFMSEAGLLRRSRA